MIIEKIKLENFRSHTATEMDFNTGITTMMGANGAGKSSIFEAISFALFKQYTTKRIEQLITTGAKKMSVEVTFKVDGNTYRVKRERSKNSKANLSILEDGHFQNLVSGDQDVTGYIENLLEMDGDLFLNAVYVRQGEIADLVDKTPAEKKQMIGRLLGIDSLEKAWKQMKFIIEKYEMDGVKLEGKLESLEDLDTEITTKQDEKTNLEGEIAYTTEALSENVAELETIKEKKEAMDETAIKYGELSTKHHGIKEILQQNNAELEGLRADLTSIEDKEIEINDIKAIIGNIEPLRKLKEQEENIKQLKIKEETLLKDISKIEALNQTLMEYKEEYEYQSFIQEAIEIIDENLNEKRTKVSNLRVQNQALDKPIKELEEVKDSCPICKSDITSEKRDELLEGYRTQLHENKTLIGTLQLEVQDLLQEQAERKERLGVAKENSDKYIAAKGALESMDDLEVYQKSLTENRESLKEEKRLFESVGFTGDIDKELARFESLNEKHHRLEGEVSRKEAVLRKLETTENSIQKTMEELGNVKETLDGLGYSAQCHGRVKSEWEEKSKTVNILSGKKHSLTGQLEQLSNSIRDLETKRKHFEKLGEELKNVKDFVKLLNLIRDVYGKDGVQRELRNISRPLIEAKTRELFERFNFEYSDIQLDEEYNLSIFGPAGESNLDMISGGERIAVALALRMAITQVISGNSLELIMLDEPTIHLDEYRRQELIELLKKMSILPQMIIVTHDSDLEEAADNILRIEKENGDSSVVEVGGI